LSGGPGRRRTWSAFVKGKDEKRRQPAYVKQDGDNRRIGAMRAAVIFWLAKGETVAGA
jgi:hypothetical protein